MSDDEGLGCAGKNWEAGYWYLTSSKNEVTVSAGIPEAERTKEGYQRALAVVTGTGPRAGTWAPGSPDTAVPDVLTLAACRGTRHK